jgi:hypothetical protein
MKTLYISILISIFILLEPLSFAHGDILEIQYMSVYTNKDSYGKGEVIKISGEIQSANGMTVSKDIPITIVLTNNVLQKTMETLKTYPSIDGNFAVAGIPTTNSSWESSGTYTVTASYGNFANTTTTFSFEVGDRNLLSPLKQSELGVPSDKIECRSDLQLIIKSENNSTACVKQQTVQALVKRGWIVETNLPKSPLGITGLNSEYSIGQPIDATVNYTGYVNGGIYPDVKILNADNGSKVWGNCGYPYYTHTELAGGGSFGTFTYNVRCSTQYPIINETGTYMMIASLYSNTAKAKFTVVKPLMLPTSFEPCNTPYPQSDSGIAVLYMPANSTGKLCVDYSNPNPPRSTDVRIFEAQHLSEDTKDIQVFPPQNNIPQGNSTIVYTLKTSKVGFYGLTLFCYGTPLAVGYDNQSRIVTNDFPWLGQTFYCPMQSYTFHISGLSGIGVKYIPYP